jgi:hypothetical protein
LVEYASTVWKPYTKTEINKIEAVQRRADRYAVSNQRHRSSVSNMLQRLKWRPLANRRKDARLMMMYKIDRELVSITKETGIFNQRACSLILIDGIFRFLLRNPRVLFALAVILFMC